MKRMVLGATDTLGILKLPSQEDTDSICHAIMHASSNSRQLTWILLPRQILSPAATIVATETTSRTMPVDRVTGRLSPKEITITLKFLTRNQVEVTI
jgi:hypothetical protein